MKKTTLSKLVKQALKEVILEQTDYSKNRLRVSSETIKDLSIPLTLGEQREVEDSLGIDKDKINQTFEFLVKNSKQGTPLENIANDPLLTGINIDGLEAVYKTIPTLTLEEWTSLLPDLTSGIGSTGTPASCTQSQTQGYGTLYIYNANTCLSEEVDDGFICCSDNNNYTNQLQAPPQYSFANSSTGWNISGFNGVGACYCPSGNLGDCLGNNLNQFTYADFVAWMSNPNQGNAIGGTSQPDGMCPSLNNFPFTLLGQCYSDAANSGCGGCAHDKADNYVSTGGGAPLGCPDQFSNFDPSILDCCQFTGCGAIGTAGSGITPQATNVGFANSNCGTGTSCASINPGVPDAQADEQQVYWNDGAGPNGLSCQFPVDGCSTFTIPGFGQPTNWNGSGQPGQVWHDSGYSYQQSGNPSPHYLTALDPPASPVCTVEECTADELDPNGANSALLANSTGNTWVGSDGTYNLPAPGFILSNDQNKCAIQGCTDEFNGNGVANTTWLNPALFPNITITDDPSYCQAEDPGCGPVGSVTGIFWSNYMATATSMNGECNFQGCTDPDPNNDGSNLNTLSSNYICNQTNTQYMCDQAGVTGIPDLTNPDIINSSNPFQHDQSSCINIPGCIDPTATNYEPLATIDNGTCGYAGCTYLQATNFVSNASNYTDDGSCVFDWCYDDETATNYFCEIFDFLCYNPTGILDEFDPTLVGNVTDNQSCVGGCVYGCLDQPNGMGSGNPGFQEYSNYGGPGNTNSISPIVTCDDGSCIDCVYGCTNPIALNYDPSATCNDGTCQAVVSGCTDPAANNYDTNVNTDDGTCRYDGCTDDGSKDQTWYTGGNLAGVDYSIILGNPAIYPGVDACNVANLSANNIDEDGSCNYQTCGGCTDPGACNYNISATIEDGSCLYPGNPQTGTIDPTYTCDCNNNPLSGYCDCTGTIDLGCCQSGGGEDLGCGCGEIGPDDCNECPSDNGGVPNSAQDCNGVCFGSAEVDDCGVCHPGGQSSPNISHYHGTIAHGWNACDGCMYDLAGSGGTYHASHTQDTDPDGSCLFTACIDNTTYPLSTNYICLTSERPDLCLDSTGTGPCTAQDHTCIINQSLGTWTPSSCTIPSTGCRDAGVSGAFAPLTWGTFGPYTSGQNNGVNGQADNYDPLIGVGGECDGSSTIAAYQCKPGPDGIMQTYDLTGTNPLSTDNPYGCCCEYTPGCTDPLYINYDQSATQDDGSCQTLIVEGCTNPGFGNYSPTATQEDGSCVYDGCVDSGDWAGGNGQSLHLNYACFEQAQVSNAVEVTLGATVIPAGTPKPVWEWLGCNTLGANGNFNTQYGTFTDGTVFNSSTGVNLYDPLDVISPPGAEPGQCVGYTGGPDGCINDYDGDGIPNPTYIQNNGTTLTNATPGGFSILSSADNGTCKYVGCADKKATNYFCVDNQLLCYLDPIGGVDLIMNPQFGTLYQTSEYSCIFPESYNCDNINDAGTSQTGCVDPGDGTGTHATLADCEAVCIEVSYDCDPIDGCVDPLDGSGQYNIEDAGLANYLQPIPLDAYGDPLSQCGDTPANGGCNSATFNCDPNLGCFDPLDSSGTFTSLEDCRGECTSYNCEPDVGCTDPGNGSGTYVGDPYSTNPIPLIQMCEDECIECSMVDAKECLGTATKTFSCLEIDSLPGDPSLPGANNTTPVNAYSMGTYFLGPGSGGPVPTVGPLAEQISKDILRNDQATAKNLANDSKYGNGLHTWEVMTINNIFSIQPHIDYPSTTCYEGYNCNPIPNGDCVGSGNQSGDYTGPNALSDCNDNCFPPTFDCYRGNGTCSDPGNGMGEYTYQTATLHGFTDPLAECQGLVDANGFNDPNGEPNCFEQADDVCGEGCKTPGFLTTGWCCTPGQQGPTNLPITNNNPACCNGYIGTGTTCFIGDTLITMPDNTTKRIDELKVDEIVKSEKETSQIIKIDIHEGEFDLYSINGSKHFTTEDHPFQTTEGWKAIIPDKTKENHQIEAFVLKVGDTLIKDNGEQEEIITLEKSSKITTTVYNLRLDNEHVYYANNYLVHNGGVKRKLNEDANIYGYNADGEPIYTPVGKTGMTGGTGGGGKKDTDKEIIAKSKIKPDIPTKTPDTPEIKESRKLRNEFKKEFMNSSKSNKEVKIKEAIKNILRKKKK